MVQTFGAQVRAVDDVRTWLRLSARRVRRLTTCGNDNAESDEKLTTGNKHENLPRGNFLYFFGWVGACGGDSVAVWLVRALSGAAASGGPDWIEGLQG